MPRAARSQEGVKKDLKTAPPDGYVILVRLSFDQFLQRQEMAGVLSVSASSRGRDIAGTLAMAQKKVTAYEFANCIIDHNLTDDSDVAFDFKGTSWMGLKGLDPKVADEIATYIDEMHQFAGDDTLPNE